METDTLLIFGYRSPAPGTSPSLPPGFVTICLRFAWCTERAIVENGASVFDRFVCVRCAGVLEEAIALGSVCKYIGKSIGARERLSIVVVWIRHAGSP